MQGWGPDGAELVIRSKLPASQLSGTVNSVLQQLNAGQPPRELRPIQQIVDHAVSPRRFFMMLVTFFAALGLLLASLGIYGVIAYSVTRRTQEIGIRMALGASPGKVQMSVLSTTLRMAVVGIIIGTLASLGATRLIASLLFGTNAADAATFFGMIVVLAFVALVAGYIPSRRASRINPMVALRNG
jgi:ABC-type antimicrobial peptide transport system permease subunit